MAGKRGTYQNDDHKAEQQEDENDRVDDREPMDFERFGKEPARTQQFTTIGEFDAWNGGKAEELKIKPYWKRVEKEEYLVFSHVTL